MPTASWGDGTKYGSATINYGYPMGASGSVHVGAGTGSIQLCDSIQINIDSTGAVGAGTWHYILRNSGTGAFFSSTTTTIPASFSFPRSDINATASNFTLTFSGTFTSGDQYLFHLGDTVPSHTGAGTGTVTAGFSSAGYYYHQFKTTVTLGGAAGTATWNYSTDGRATVSVSNAKWAMIPGGASGSTDEFPVIVAGTLTATDTYTFCANYAINKLGNSFLGLGAKLTLATGTNLGALHLFCEPSGAWDIKVNITADGSAGDCNWDVYLNGVLKSSRTAYNSYALIVDSVSGTVVNVSLVNNWSAVKTYKTGDSYIYHLSQVA